MDQYVGEIRMFAGDYAPQGWEFCNGQLVPISQYEALYALIGTRYGGDGITNFALPDLRGRVPIHQGKGLQSAKQYMIGEKGGSEAVAISINEMPQHNHGVAVTTQPGANESPSGSIWAKNINQYSTNAADKTMSVNAISTVGSNRPHDNMMPYVTISFIIALYGIFPVKS